jgi:two-component system LytT family response regulator
VAVFNPCLRPARNEGLGSGLATLQRRLAMIGGHLQAGHMAAATGSACSCRNDGMMRPLSVLLVDDVALARHRLRELLAHIPQVRVDAEAASLTRHDSTCWGGASICCCWIWYCPMAAVGAAGAARAGRAHHLRDRAAQHALQAFELGVADYLLKPVALPRLQEAITRVRRLAGLGDDGQATPRRCPCRRWAERSTYRWRRSTTSTWPGTMRASTSGSACLLRETIARLAERLAPGGLLRVHRSVLVNPLRVQGVVERHNGDALLELAGGVQVPVSRSYRTALAAALEARLKHG